MKRFIQFLMFVLLVFTATVSVAGPLDLVITTSGRESNFCTGDDGSIKVFVTDTTGQITNFHFQWYYSDTAILTNETGWMQVAGAEESVLSFDSIVPTNSGYYYCKVLFGLNYQSTRNSERIHVNVFQGVPTVAGVNAPPVVCEGEAIDFEATGVAGQQTRTWYFGDEMLSYGNSYHIASALPSNSGEYTFVASNACGDAVYGPFVVSVTELPRIVSQPRSAGICAGDDLHFGVRATGDDLQYQWFYQGAEYDATNPTSTSDTLVIAQVPDVSYTATFCVQVSNSCATVTSRNVGTVVSEMPSIVGHPRPETVCAGVEVSLSSDATTNYPIDTITYQWYLDGVPVEGGISNIISFAMDSAHMGEYYCEFTNGCGTVRSNSAQVSVMMPPVVESQPVDISVCEGESADLFAKITGFEPIEYTWFKDNGENLDFTDITDLDHDITGNHTNTLVANPASEAHEHFYYCLATNQCGSVRTDTVYITVNQHIKIYPLLPASFVVCEGIDTLIDISMAGGVPSIYEGSEHVYDFEEAGVTFAWHRHGETEVLSDSPILHFASVSEDDYGYYVCDVENSCGLATDNYGYTIDPIFVSVIATPTILVQPQDLDVCTGGSLSLSLTADGDGLRYVWYRNGEMLNNNQPTYTAPGVAAQYGGEYWCKVESEHGCAAAYSDTVTVTVGTTPEISWQPTPAVMAICEGEEYALRMRATGDGVHYQWYNNGVAIPGQTTDSLYIAHVTRSNDGVFYCIASNACDEARTNNATLTVNNAPDMTLGPDRNPCRGESVVLGPQGDEEYGHYSWNFGTYGYQPTLTVSLGGTYILEVSDSAHGNCVARDTVVVTYHDYFDIAFDSTEVITCGQFVLDAGAGAAEYQWSTTDMTSSITIGMSGFYMVTVDGDGYGCTTSAAVNVTIGEEIVINLGDDFTASVDSVVEIGVPAVFESYMWNTGYTGPKLTVSGDDYGIGPHTFWVQVSNSGCHASDTIVINFMEGGYVAEESMPLASIYPNPASDYLNIVSANGAMSSIQIYDMTGRLVKDVKINDEVFTLNVETMVDATYFVKIIYSDGNTGVSKFIINR
ncbi:MAG: immunoglobulin domain-containing protein [Bacteroidales bacterium]|nr:immunoglobulin domain-containing protein [Bacteroidales bacterium]